jgi:hypothetical protein
MRALVEKAIIDHLGTKSVEWGTVYLEGREASLEDQLNYAHDVLRRDGGLFLEKWGKYLDEEYLVHFEDMRKDYYVNFYLEKYQQNVTQLSKHIRNRRYAYMQQLIKEGNYFTEINMRLRNPSLYETYIWRYMSNQERMEQSFDASMNLSDRLFYEIDYCQAKQQQENQSEDRETNEPCTISGLNISEEERSVLRREFRALMEERFLQGQEPNFDYTLIDHNESYDQFTEQEADLEEIYFEGEEELQISREQEKIS